MIRLHEAKLLQNLHRSLSKSLPEAMKVYGSIFHINRGNPFNLDVLVDSWPDYQTVITRPQKQEMMDDKDHYINTYHIFSKDFQKLPEILGSDSVINWRQSLTIQGCQNGLHEKIRDIVASKSIKMDYSKRFLYIRDDVLESGTANTNNLLSLYEAICSENVKFRRNNNIKPSLLDVSHAELVNNNWKYGQNEKSLRFVKRCLQNFPGYCLLGPEGNPISWTIIEHTCELRMSYTLPEYRSRRITQWMGIGYMQHLKENDMPFYGHVEEMNEQSHKLAKFLGFHPMDCGWHEWKCVPDELL
ncbi:glycine N-acyltransferase-like protein 2 [Antechinus flavipes]|uniref:glycine N-acyltransferase-like protein 2 n=1 Tax=Antechinus flavipes TaxID=38775 RepID=UPI002235A9F0|nr:glycine N-acyltransferase-like protein 2 [Antechinus flavipes]